jgi:hypothetical protein
MSATLASVIPLQRQATPDPCEIIAGLMVTARITPDRVERATAHLAEVVPSAAKFLPGVLAAYFDLKPRAS